MLNLCRDKRRVPRATRARTVLGVNSVHLVMPDTAPTMLPTVTNVNSGKQQPLLLRQRATNVKRAISGTHVELVQCAPSATTKTPKDNSTAPTRASRLEKYPTKNERGVNCHRGGLAKSALNICTTKKIKHNGNAANAPTAHIAMPTP